MTTAAPSAPVWRGSGPAPARLVEVEDGLAADTALRWMSEGAGLVWQGDYHQAVQLLQALQRRLAKKPQPPAKDLLDAFHQGRKRQAEQARLLSRLLLRFEAGHDLKLRRAPEAQAAAQAALGDAPEPYLLPLREWLGMVGSWQWQQTGLALPQLGGARLHAHYGVFAPTRHEYLDLVLQAPLPEALRQHPLAVDVGTGSGVLTALLARRGVRALLATDTSERALACAAENFARLGVQATLEQAALFGTAQQAGLLVCNPPWLPGKVNTLLDAAVYDPDSAMLRGFLAGAAARLAPGGEAWLIVSDLAERIGLRAADALGGWIAAAGLQVIARLDATPRHRRARDADDPLHAARAAEVVSLWRLQRA
ncbi:methyltransferase [Inhella sp.]|uniref:methyltransferase n=1 Tax=Inhella sp. TaxID=1921806 RepID=UPI0035B10E45